MSRLADLSHSLDPCTEVRKFHIWQHIIPRRSQSDKRMARDSWIRMASQSIHVNGSGTIGAWIAHQPKHHVVICSVHLLGLMVSLTPPEHRHEAY